MLKGAFIRTVIKVLATIGILVFLIYIVLNNLNDIRQYRVSIDIINLIISFAVLITASILLSFYWHFITRILQCNLDLSKSIRYRLVSEIGKYIPGRIFGYSYLIMSYKDEGQDYIRVMNSTLYELYLSVLSAFMYFSVIQLFIPFGILDKYKIGFILASFAGILFLHPFFFGKISDILCAIFKKDRLVYKIKFSKALLLLLFYLSFWIIAGFGFFLLINTFIEARISDLFYLSGSFAISSLAGILFFFLPAGLGAREGLLIYLLGVHLGDALAIIVAISSRAWIVLADVSLWLYAFLSKIIYRKEAT